jgi:DNA-binding protein H-NS
MTPGNVLRIRPTVEKMAYTNPEIAELLAKQDTLNKQLAEAKHRETRQVLIEIVQKMREYGISLDELMGRKAGAQKQQPVAQTAAPEPVSEPKYRDPVSGATWTGRGRAPNWIAGKNREDYLIDRRGMSKAAVQAALFGDEL